MLIMALVPTFDPVAALTDHGPLGLIIIAFITGWVVPGPIVKAKDAELKRLQMLLEEKVIPITEQYGSTLADLTTVLKDITPVLKTKVGYSTEEIPRVPDQRRVRSGR